ncbi:MAG: helix-turn-helix transcriptional regulator [Chloroflexota bacterium]
MAIEKVLVEDSNLRLGNARLVCELAIQVQGKRAKKAALTCRQREILRLVASRATNQQIADQLFVSLATVKRDLNHIFQYFNVADRSAAVAEALCRRLL